MKSPILCFRENPDLSFWSHLIRHRQTSNGLPTEKPKSGNIRSSLCPFVPYPAATTKKSQLEGMIANGSPIVKRNVNSGRQRGIDWSLYVIFDISWNGQTVCPQLALWNVSDQVAGKGRKFVKGTRCADKWGPRIMFIFCMGMDNKWSFLGAWVVKKRSFGRVEDSVFSGIGVRILRLRDLPDGTKKAGE